MSGGARYEVLVSEGVVDLGKRVTEAVNDGAALVGGVALHVEQTRDGVLVRWAQAVVWPAAERKEETDAG